MIAFEALLAVLAGVFAGLTGGGGGIIFVPLLIMIGLPPMSAVATSNVSIVITTAAATVNNARHGMVPWKRVGLIAIGAVIMGPIGAFISLRMPGTVMLVALICLNLVNLYIVERRARQVAPSSDLRDASDVGDNNLGKVVSTGAAGGAMAGLFGVGGGLIMVPLQVAWLHTPIRMAARISLAVIIATSGSAALGFALQGGDIDWVRGAILGLGGIIGAPIGAHVLRRITGRTATRILQGVIVAVTISLVWRLIG